MKVTYEYAHERLIYNPESGELRWKTRSETTFKHKGYAADWNKRHAGKLAGSKDQDGYIFLKFEDKYVVRSHRLIWLMQTGEWPKNQIDHIDRNTSNNRFSNLREATISENALNRKTNTRNKTGIKGVYWATYCSCWIVEIKILNKRYTKRAHTLEKARQIADEFRNKHHGERAYHG